MSDANNPFDQQGDGALGFESQKKEEKYNTQYLASSLQKDRRTSQWIVLAVVALAGLGLLIAMLRDPAPPKMPPLPAAPAAAAPVESETKTGE